MLDYDIDILYAKHMRVIKNKVIALPSSAPPASVSLPLASPASEAGIDMHDPSVQIRSRVTLA
jgi:hypothetical protein